MRLPWGIVAPVLVGLPMVTWILGNAPNANRAVQETPWWLLSVTLLVALSLAVAERDPWLGAFSAYMAVRSLWTRTPWAFETAQAITFGVLIIQTAREIPRRWHPQVGLGIGAMALFQAGYAALQNVVVAGNPPTVQWVWGSWVMALLGNPNHLGAYLAIASGVAPMLFLLGILFGVVLTWSRLPVLAVGVVLLMRFRRAWRVMAPISAALLVAVVLVRGGPTVHLGERWLIQRMTLQALSMAPMFGFGPGSWQSIGPVLQSAPSIRGQLTEMFGEAHNDALQLGFEGGLVAVGLVALWIWSHRRIFASATYGGPLLASGMVAVGSFPFHIAPLAALICLVVGLALGEEEGHGRPRA